MKDRSKILFGLVMLLMVVGIIGFSYAIFTTKVEKKGALNIVAGTLSCPIQIEGIEGNQIELVNQTEKEVEVTIRNDSQVPIHSTITYLKNDNVEVLASSSNGDFIDKENLSVGETRTYTIKLINKTNTTQTVTLNGKCGLSNKTLAIADTEEEITGNYERVEPNAPELVTGLIPVVYDESQSSWVKADTTKKWYNYDKQEWANAVTIGLDEDGVGTKKRESYQTAEAGTKIPIDDINTMWVWIPRYEYKYTNLGEQYAGGTAEQPGEIIINFLDGINDTPSNENYKVHPAFTFGEDELTGIWYGKFEPSNQEKKFNEGEANSSSLTPIIKPNTTSWRYVQPVNMFYAAFNMKSSENASTYGFSSDGSIDTHMHKNSEWGAVAYLSQSKYGKYGNDMYEEDDKEVYINNCSSYITGIAGDTIDAEESADTCNTNTYETLAGQKASTTGNITGVYDMSGGANEYVMGALEDESTGKPTITASGFTNDTNENTKLPDAKYYDLYTNIPSATACGGGVCYGHALSETSGWYGDYRNFVNSGNHWLLRNRYYSLSSNAGVFAYVCSFGPAAIFNSFRIVLAPMK